MEIIKGTYSSAIVYTTETPDTSLDQYARAQLQALCDNECQAEGRIRVMPDVHPGKVGTIGLTMTVGERLMPLLTGIDIGCGVAMTRISKGRREWDTALSRAVSRRGLPPDKNPTQRQMSLTSHTYSLLEVLISQKHQMTRAHQMKA